MKKYPSIIKNYPHILHGADYNPEQWINTKEIWKEDMRLAKLAGINSWTIGVFSWASIEKEEGVYDFSFLDEIMDNMAKNNMKAVLATPSGARPAWLSQKYPEVLRVNEDRRRILHGNRHNHCYTSPVYREKTAAIDSALARHFANHPALGVWHISNEYGGECHCELCQEAFRAWLKKRYNNDLDKLNEAWWTTFWSHTYTDWSQIESPSSIGESSIQGLILDWKRFVDHQTADFMLNEIKAVKAVTPDIPVTTNFLHFTHHLDYFKLCKYVDVVSWDSYPTWTSDDEEDFYIAAETAFCHNLYRSLKDGRPFMLMESCPTITNWQPVGKLHYPNSHKLHSVQAIAHGADTVQYFQFRRSRGCVEKFHGAVVDHEGSENTRVFKEVAAVGDLIKKLDDVVGTTIQAEVAIVYDWENRWALEECRGFLKQKNYIKTVVENYIPFFKKGIPVDVVNMDKDISKYKLVVAPMLYMLKEEFANRIIDFVKNGGTFVATYLTGYVNETDLCYLGGFPGLIKEVLGIWCEELDSLRPGSTNFVTYKNKDYQFCDFAEMIHLRGAKALGVYKEDFYAGNPAITVNEYGSGSAYFIGARLGEDFNDEFYNDICEKAKIKRIIESELPRGTTAMVRSDEENKYIFIMNFTKRPQTIDIADGGINVENGEKVAGEVSVGPYGVLIYKTCNKN